ncbi:MAG: hypothetical protein JXA36_03850 [Coriobacteriia bacterium]|nr:hypothetical protein [Coriobacteriia bacterium]
MKRILGCTAVLVALLLALGGCDGAAEDVAEDAAQTAVTSEVAAPTQVFDAIPTDGPGESAALSMVPGALEQAKEMREAAGMEWPDLEGIEPILTAYVIAVDMSDQGALFEVRADGVPHNLYAYQRALDVASAVWAPTSQIGDARGLPQSDAEKAAVASVEAAIRDSFPDDAFSVAIYGYRFVYLAEGESVLTLEVGTDGAVFSAGD